jgi:ER-bound oxygenase mpaB/B'/Rubber oxygenase, catalytic domain/Nitrile hydratase, alpha chain
MANLSGCRQADRARRADGAASARGDAHLDRRRDGSGRLGRFEAGFKGALRVRLMHAMVRSGMNRRPDWNYADWDQPVNQSTLAGTLLLFSLGNVLGSQALGLRFNRREKDAVFHLWRYIGYLLGVDVEVLPTSELLVLPMRPDGTADMSEEQLAGIVTRDSMIGVQRL